MSVSNGELRISTYTGSDGTTVEKAIGRTKPTTTATTASSYTSLVSLRQLADVVVDMVGNVPVLQPEGSEGNHRAMLTAYGYHSSIDDKTLIEKLYLVNERALYANDADGNQHLVSADYIGQVTWTFGTQAAEDVVDPSGNQYNYPKTVAWSDGGTYAGFVADLVSIATIPTDGTVVAGEGGGYLAIPDVPGVGILRVPQSGSTVTSYTQAFRAWS